MQLSTQQDRRKGQQQEQLRSWSIITAKSTSHEHKNEIVRTRLAAEFVSYQSAHEIDANENGRSGFLYPVEKPNTMTARLTKLHHEPFLKIVYPVTLLHNMYSLRDLANGVRYTVEIFHTNILLQDSFNVECKDNSRSAKDALRLGNRNTQSQVFIRIPLLVEGFFAIMFNNTKEQSFCGAIRV